MGEDCEVMRQTTSTRATPEKATIGSMLPVDGGRKFVGVLSEEREFQGPIEGTCSQMYIHVIVQPSWDLGLI